MKKFIDSCMKDYHAGMCAAQEEELVSIYSIRMNDEERYYKNISGLNAEKLCRAYAECDKPFVEMGKYGEQMTAAEYAYIEQGNRLDFSIEFDEETDQITIFNGKNFEHKGLRAILFPEQEEILSGEEAVIGVEEAVFKSRRMPNE